jgi:hypothetical protein
VRFAIRESRRLLRSAIAWRSSLEARAYWWAAEFFIRHGTPRHAFKSYPDPKGPENLP